MTRIKFPESFERKVHSVVPGATQWLYQDGDIRISIVGGGRGLYGDGVRTFEMWDFAEDGPQSYLLAEEINRYLDEVYNLG